MIISKELLSEVLGCDVNSIEGITESGFIFHYRKKNDELEMEYINIHELEHKCKVWAWNKLYEVIPRAGGAEIMYLKTGCMLYTVAFEEIDNPKPFDPRFTIEACQWIYDKEGK